jgi:hypothetical protein
MQFNATRESPRDSFESVISSPRPTDSKIFHCLCSLGYIIVVSHWSQNTTTAIMTKYPLSALVEHRICEDEIWPTFPSTPKHMIPTFSKKRWRARNLQIKTGNTIFNGKIPRALSERQNSHRGMGTSEAKFPRCRRIMEKERNGYYRNEEDEYEKRIDEVRAERRRVVG